MILGYDISEFQGVVDYTVLETDFLIIRDVYSTTHIDNQFARNWAQARQNNIARWSYSFAEPQFTTPAESVAFTLAAHDEYQPGEGQVVDIERDLPNIVSWTAEWIDRFVAAKGFIALVYLNRFLLGKYDWSPVIQR